MPRPVLALLTDFGTRDHYVGAMKGAALTICPDATLIDITHEIAPQDVMGGALELAAAAPYFPAGTIFVAVVDPGVGSARRGLAAAAGGCHFVGPDNGLLSAVFERTPPDVVVELTDPQYARPTISRTFEGRDRFAPAAAWLATGVGIAALGPAITDWRRLDVPHPSVTESALTGEIIRVDRFGNLVTNIGRESFDRFAGQQTVAVACGSQRVPVVSTYAEAGAGDVIALFGSTGLLEVAVNGGDAAGHLGLRRGDAVAVTRASMPRLAR